MEERKIIEKAIENGSSKKSIADILGKDKSTIGKEIFLHRILKYKCPYSVDCAAFARCRNKNRPICSSGCQDYQKFKCKRRDRTPGACNGCEKYKSCRYDKYRYYADIAQHEYRETLTGTREGINATLSEIKDLGSQIKPLLDQGQSVYVILQNHPEIGLSEKTLYNYIENGVFQDAGISINAMNLKRQVGRRQMKKSKRTEYKKRKDRTYLRGRTYDCFEEYIDENPNASVVEMDTVYNDVTSGPFIQTFKFLKYDLLFAVYHDEKTAEEMLKGINLLEDILGLSLFRKEVEVLKTDRGSEFTMAEAAETDSDGTRRTRVYYCDPMASRQKGSLENVHLLLREICPKECDLRALGLTCQEKMNISSSHINSYPKQKLSGKTSFEMVKFLSPELFDRFIQFGLFVVPPDKVTLKPYILKD